MEAFSIIFDTMSSQWFWYDRHNKKFHGAFSSEREAIDAASSAKKIFRVAFDG